jgi:hypothetical protein
VEWSLNIESEIFIEFSLLWLSLELIDIDDIPKLIGLSMSLAKNDVLVFNIFVVLNFH